MRQEQERSPERRVGDWVILLDLFPGLLNKIFSGLLNQKTCTVEFWVKLFPLKRVVFVLKSEFRLPCDSLSLEM